MRFIIAFLMEERLSMKHSRKVRKHEALLCSVFVLKQTKQS
jgi:hypothetical protein